MPRPHHHSNSRNRPGDKTRDLAIRAQYRNFLLSNLQSLHQTEQRPAENSMDTIIPSVLSTEASGKDGDDDAHNTQLLSPRSATWLGQTSVGDLAKGGVGGGSRTDRRSTFHVFRTRASFSNADTLSLDTPLSFSRAIFLWLCLVCRVFFFFHRLSATAL